VRLGRGVPEPLYLQLAAIRRGEPTGRIPSVEPLAQQYAAAAGTAERALAVLGVLCGQRWVAFLVSVTPWRVGL
jgi:hypothetical protein